MDSGAEHVVSSVVKRLSDLLNEKGKFLSTREDVQARKIVYDLREIIPLLRDAEAKQIEESEIRELVADIKETANDARDVLESYIRKVGAPGWIGGVRRNAFNNIPIIRKCAGLKAKDIEDRISEIKIILRSYNIRDVTPEGESSSSQNSTSTSTGPLMRSLSFVDDGDDFVGFEEDIERLVGILVGDGSDTSGKKTVWIHGEDGMGKTSIARKIYNHPRVKRHFSAFAWVNTFSESDKVDLKSIMRHILLSLGAPLVPRNEELVPNLTRELQRRRCLVVFADVSFEDFLPSNLLTNKGDSKFLLTGRLDIISSYPYSNYSYSNYHYPYSNNGRYFWYEAKGLNEDESWELINRKVLHERGTRNYCITPPPYMLN